MHTKQQIFGLIMVCCLAETWAINMEYTVQIAAGTEDCFWESFPDKKELEIDYQVIDGGDRDINFRLVSPQNRDIVHEGGKSESLVTFTAQEPGEYGLCFDNTFSHFSSKVVYFDVYSTDDDQDEDIDEDKFANDKSQLSEILDMTVKEFLDLMERIRQNLQRSVHIQGLLKIHEAKDRNTQETNFRIVNMFSTFQLVFMVVVACVQVFMIRKLFQDKKTVTGGALRQRT